MILQALCEYYQRKSRDRDSGLASKGFEQKAIPFVVVIDDNGRFIVLKDTREPQGKKLVARDYLVPQGKKRSGGKSYEVANLLWDHYGYLLNQPKQDKPDIPPNEKDIEMAHKQHQSFIRQVDEIVAQLPDCLDACAVQGFLSQPNEVDKVRADPIYAECLKIKGCNLAFQRAGEDHLCCQAVELQSYIAADDNGAESIHGVCLVTGKRGPVARLHDGIGQIVGKPTPLASINAKAFESYGKSQGLNFPVGELAAFQYATALNHLLRRDSKQKLYVSGTTLVCWAQRDAPLETELPMLFGQQSDAPDQGVEKVIEHYRSLYDGAAQNADDQQRFYVLGLAPNAPARIVVRFWLCGTVAEFRLRIADWFRDIQIIGYEAFGFPSLYRLVLSTALLQKSDNLPPNLMGDIYLAILQGLPLPATLFQGVIRRIKAERGYVNYERACLLKACLNRRHRQINKVLSSIDKELTVSLNQEDTRIGYRLGRLFAVLEKLQQDAQGSGLNSTIRDRYYSSASCTPKAVFATLIRLSTHHLNKLAGAYRVTTDRRIQEIVTSIQEFPAHLNLDEQGLFAIGYYHQKQSLYTKKETQQKSSAEEGATL
ncbi:type I-C CRISPR-associated protein Cas8c/Csd1 [Agarivorans sp. QJM3NY_29]|uniref:type I-C CRISPR-associated protein Cas8c/Csd1 n=1 Tax=unclassified Agarivorans TaxID=2636026 RepID=UPI003D7CC453